jgi:hypothetical protein
VETTCDEVKQKCGNFYQRKAFVARFAFPDDRTTKEDFGGNLSYYGANC